jgi:deoxyhypusine synthase
MMPLKGILMLNELEDLQVKGDRKLADLLSRMAKMGGFEGRNLGEAFVILKGMLRDSSCLKLISFPAAVVSTGMRGVIKEMIKRRLFDVIITTCGTLDHDLARCYANYYSGSFFVDDEQLLRKGYHRLGSVFIPKEAYGPLIEKKLRGFLEREGLLELGARPLHEVIWKLGEELCDESSILWWASKLRIPIIIPAPLDGAVGHHLWLAHQRLKEFRIDLMQDQDLLADMIFNAKRLGGLVIGGGVSKHHLIWWSQFKGGLHYAVYITTAIEYDGSLSGALTREAISWGKISGRARHVTVHCDATIALPLLASALFSLEIT